MPDDDNERYLQYLREQQREDDEQEQLAREEYEREDYTDAD